jgi:hypothetical protein
MKAVVFIAFLTCASFIAKAQSKLSEKDLANLVALADLYSHDNMFKNDGIAKRADSLRTPVLSHVIDALIATGVADTSVIAKRFLTRPNNDELKIWYAIREIHYTRIDSTRKKLPPKQVAENILALDIDERALLNNYYSHLLSSGLAFLFNKADLSAYDINLDSYGLKTETEKAILFFRMVDPMIRGRFMVLNAMKKYDKLEEFARHMPLFNGKPYYYYTNLNFEDFDWVSHNKPESFKKFNINFLAQSELLQLNAAALQKNKAMGQDIYYNSILNKPEYFEYTEIKDILQKFYNQGKK